MDTYRSWRRRASASSAAAAIIVVVVVVAMAPNLSKFLIFLPPKNFMTPFDYLFLMFLFLYVSSDLFFVSTLILLKGPLLRHLDASIRSPKSCLIYILLLLLLLIRFLLYNKPYRLKSGIFWFLLSFQRLVSTITLAYRLHTYIERLEVICARPMTSRGYFYKNQY